MRTTRLVTTMARAAARGAPLRSAAAPARAGRRAFASGGESKVADKAAKAANKATEGAKDAADKAATAGKAAAEDAAAAGKKVVNEAAAAGKAGAKAAAEGGGGSGGGIILLGLLAGGAGYYAYTQGMLDDILGKPSASGSAGGKAAASSGGAEPPRKLASEVAKAVESLIDDDDNRGPLLVRLAWHCSGTFARGGKPQGGSDGARMRFGPEANDGANAGLDQARTLLEPIKKAHPELSYADLYTYAGAVAIEHMGGPHVPFRFGRTDYQSEEEVAATEAAVVGGRLPDAAKGSDHIRDVFYRMGFNDQEIVALSGAHTLGRCHTDRSGFDGPWSFAPTTMSNQYFTLLENEIKKPGYWSVRKWDGPKQYEDPTKTLMMLPTDMALVWDDKFKPVVVKYANDEEAFFRDFAAAFSRLLHLGVKEDKLSKAL